MADKKISQLTAASTPLAGTEVLPIVQGGSTVKVSVDNLTAGRTVSASTVNATTVDATNVEVTNVKAKDGTASISIADSTGVASLSADPILSGGTANGVVYLNASKAATSGSAITYNGTTFGADAAVVINDSGADRDTRIEGDTDANLFFVDASADKIGVGTNNPIYKLDVRGAGAVIGIGDTGTTGSTLFGFVNNGNNGIGAINFLNGGDMGFDTGATGVAQSTKMFLTASGSLGVGTTAPNLLTWSRAVTLNDPTNANSAYELAVGGVAQAYFAADATNVYVASFANKPLLMRTNNVTRATFDTSGNLLLGGSSSPASAASSLAIFNGTAPTGSVTNGCVLYAEDVSSSSELKVRDEAGNVTTLSPHNFSLIPEGASEDMAWAYYSEKGGKRINVDMLKLARMVEKLTGEKLVYEA